MFEVPFHWVNSNISSNRLFASFFFVRLLNVFTFIIYLMRIFMFGAFIWLKSSFLLFIPMNCLRLIIYFRLNLMNFLYSKWKALSFSSMSYYAFDCIICWIYIIHIIIAHRFLHEFSVDFFFVCLFVWIKCSIVMRLSVILKKEKQILPENMNYYSYDTTK